ncbi:MAG: DUF1569 domain-containing protein [Pirellulaceae bacterium]|nr:DUF1569 domain-containing protein [Pirellulaceae bacterium]
MPVNTGKVAGRRVVAYESLDDVLMDAERLVAASDINMLGNWSLGQMLGHLAAGLHMSLDGVTYRPTWFVRLVGPFLFKQRMMRRFPAGIKLPGPMEQMLVPLNSLAPLDGLRLLQEATTRFRSDTSRKPHAVFGKLTGAQWHQLHLRHAELHMSFVTIDP